MDVFRTCYFRNWSSVYCPWWLHTVLCNLRGLLHSLPSPAPCCGSCPFRNERQNCVELLVFLLLGGSALTRNSCTVRTSNCFHCVLLFIPKTAENVIRKKKRKKQSLKSAANKLFCRYKCTRKQAVNKVLQLQKHDFGLLRRADTSFWCSQNSLIKGIFHVRRHYLRYIKYVRNVFYWQMLLCMVGCWRGK